MIGADFIDRILGISKPHEVHIGRRRGFFVNGEIKWVDDPRSFVVHDRDSLVDLVNDGSTDFPKTVFVNDKCVTADLDGGDTKVVWPLPMMEEVRVARNLSNNPFKGSSDQAVDFLRKAMLNGGTCIDEMRTALSRVDFQTTTKTTRFIGQDADQLGRSLEAKASVGHGIALKESATMLTEVFRIRGMKSYPIEVFFRMYPSDGIIEISTNKDNVESAIEAALDDLRDKIVELLPGSRVVLGACD